MPLLLIVVAAVFFVTAWIWYRSNTLTPNCTWREDRRRAAEGEAFFHCLVCGAEERLPKGKQPRHCRRQQ
ncbi:hypothetical protein QCN27_02185 [Cereibacter sp. SYSU M97828]|nr:hypothetical protein [Cereibacter flavus]